MRVQRARIFATTRGTPYTFTEPRRSNSQITCIKSSGWFLHGWRICVVYTWGGRAKPPQLSPTALPLAWTTTEQD